MICHTIRDILVSASETYGNSDAIRYKEGKNNIVSKTYQELRRDSERFSAVLAALGEQGSHIAITGMTSYSWLTAYLGTVNSGSVGVFICKTIQQSLCLIDRQHTARICGR